MIVAYVTGHEVEALPIEPLPLVAASGEKPEVTLKTKTTPIYCITDCKGKP